MISLRVRILLKKEKIFSKFGNKRMRLSNFIGVPENVELKNIRTALDFFLGMLSKSPRRIFIYL